MITNSLKELFDWTKATSQQLIDADLGIQEKPLVQSRHALNLALTGPGPCSIRLYGSLQCCDVEFVGLEPEAVLVIVRALRDFEGEKK